VKEGIIEKSGAWFSYGDERIGQGRENAKTFLKENENMCNEIEEKIRKSYSINDDEIEDKATDQAE
jgi:recombination protein RecA